MQMKMPWRRAKRDQAGRRLLLESSSQFYCGVSVLETFELLIEKTNTIDPEFQLAQLDSPRMVVRRRLRFGKRSFDSTTRKSNIALRRDVCDRAARMCISEQPACFICDRN